MVGQSQDEELTVELATVVVQARLSCVFSNVRAIPAIANPSHPFSLSPANYLNVNIVTHFSILLQEFTRQTKKS